MSTILVNDETHKEDDDTMFSDPTVDTAEDSTEEQVPEKFAGKTQAELAAMLVEAERFRGKQANEVGDLRRSVDTLLQAQLVAAQEKAPAVEEEIDFFTDPEAAVERKIANHPDILAAKQAAASSSQEATKAKLLTAHPDMSSIIADEAFGAWVKDSPIRQQLLQQADRNYDFDAANELFSTWKERAHLAERTVEVDKRERSATIKAAGTGSGNASAAGSPKKVYRRSDIVRLMNTDPDRYASMADEIFAAYKEGRVK